MMRALGADLVGMSTVPEVLAARHMGIRCLAISCVTNMAAGILPEPIDPEHVLEVGAQARDRLVALLREVVPASPAPSTRVVDLARPPVGRPRCSPTRRLAAAPRALAVAAARAALERAREQIRSRRGARRRRRARRWPSSAPVARPRCGGCSTRPVCCPHEPRPRPARAGRARPRRRGRRRLLEPRVRPRSGRPRVAPGSLAALLRRLTGAEAALVVNNNAAAVLLALAALAEGREVLVSRGELIEIGDGFRIPTCSPARARGMVEVGTTNRTRAADYERAIGPETAVILRVHQSNFRVVGFTEQPAHAELAADRARRRAAARRRPRLGRAPRTSATSRPPPRASRRRRPRVLLGRQAARRPAGGDPRRAEPTWSSGSAGIRSSGRCAQTSSPSPRSRARWRSCARPRARSGGDPRAADARRARSARPRAGRAPRGPRRRRGRGDRRAGRRRRVAARGAPELRVCDRGEPVRRSCASASRRSSGSCATAGCCSTRGR